MYQNPISKICGVFCFIGNIITEKIDLEFENSHHIIYIQMD